MFTIGKLNNIYKFKIWNFTRKIKIKKISKDPIYPGDNVIVRPILDDLQISPFIEKHFSKNPKFQEENKIKYGTVIKVLRKKHQVIIGGINKKEIYTPPEIFFSEYEKKNFSNIKREVKYLPVDIKRVSLRDPDEIDFKPLEIVTKRDENGKMQRYSKNTNEIIPKNIEYKNYFDRHFEKKEGPKDTPADLVIQKTYYGEDYISIAQEFLAKIKEKNDVESLLFLKDK